ncbi:MAG: hypothetical protein KC656_30630 [Myxococcales bacterium]|nr:hypothetical protein [Myxococcales bacterium]
MRVLRCLLLLALPLFAAGCDDDSGSGSESDGGAGPVDAAYAPEVDPAKFGPTVDNPFFPLVPGTVFHYTEETEDGVETITTTVTADTRVVAGVTCVVVHDVAEEDGEVAEDTFDWYAQDDQGNVWYFGEDTTAYDGDESTKAGSWEAGVDGAQPGILMPGDPQVGQRYRQEYYAGEAEDMGEVLALDAAATVPHGTYEGCLRTRDWTPLEPDKVEEKVYCRGVGLVQADLVEGGLEHLELVSVDAP